MWWTTGFSESVEVALEGVDTAGETVASVRSLEDDLVDVSIVDVDVSPPLVLVMLDG